MKHLGISGGGTKIGGLFGAAEVLLEEKGYKPDIISGISAGAILSVPLALKKFDEVRKMVLDFNLDTFFSQKPIKENGKFTFRSYWNIITGKPYLGKQENLPKILGRVVTREDFEDYVTGDYPACIVGAIDVITGSRHYFNLKTVKYDEYLQAVNASASIPIFTKAIVMNTEYLYDGGIRDHIATPWILENYPDISETVSIYSRPEDFKLLPEKFSDKNILKILERIMDITNVEISKTDEILENKICEIRSINQTKIFLPRVMESVYDVNKARLRKMYEEGRRQAFEVLKEFIL